MSSALTGRCVFGEYFTLAAACLCPHVACRRWEKLASVHQRLHVWYVCVCVCVRVCVCVCVLFGLNKHIEQGPLWFHVTHSKQGKIPWVFARKSLNSQQHRDPSKKPHSDWCFVKPSHFPISLISLHTNGTPASQRVKDPIFQLPGSRQVRVCRLFHTWRLALCWVGCAEKASCWLKWWFSGWWWTDSLNMPQMKSFKLTAFPYPCEDL